MMGVLSAAFAVDPTGVPIHVMLFLPDRQSHFQFIDYVTAGFERFVAVRCRNANPDCEIANFEHANTVHATSLEVRVAFFGLSKHLVAFCDHERFIRLVLQTFDVTPVVSIPYPSFELSLIHI